MCLFLWNREKSLAAACKKGGYSNVPAALLYRIINKRKEAVR